MLMHFHKVCIDIADGLGNVIQATPFILHMKNHCDIIVGHNRPDAPTSCDVVSHLFDEIVNKPPRDIPWFPIPNLRKMGSYPEWQSWFKFHGIEQPKKISSSVNSLDIDCPEHDFVIWGGCKRAWKSKQWPYWSQLADKLSSMGYSVCLTGLPGEVSPVPDCDFFFDSSLLRVGGLIKKAKAFIGNEGGLSHYSAALGTKTYIIYGGTDPVKNLPPCGDVTRISKGLGCQPCQFNVRNPEYGCAERVCLTSLSIEDVLKEIK
jgi:ADP-heptose:LPS heptosyltransferase